MLSVRGSAEENLFAFISSSNCMNIYFVWTIVDLQLCFYHYNKYKLQVNLMPTMIKIPMSIFFVGGDIVNMFFNGCYKIKRQSRIYQDCLLLYDIFFNYVPSLLKTS